MPKLAHLALPFTLAAALFVPVLASSAAAQDGGARVENRGRGPGHGQGRGPGHGQGRRGPRMGPEHVERRIAHLKHELGLDATQERLVREAFAQARTEMQAAMRTHERGTEQARTARRAVMERTHERIDAVLTPAQRATFDRLRAQHRARREQRREMRRGI